MADARPHLCDQVANEVETEQIVDAGVDHKTGGPLLSSLVLVGVCGGGGGSVKTEQIVDAGVGGVVGGVREMCEDGQASTLYLPCHTRRIRDGGARA